jgi:hypothetical protein
MQRLTVRHALMPAATVVFVTAAVGLVLFGTRALPAIALAVTVVVGGAALMLWYATRRADPQR